MLSAIDKLHKLYALTSGPAVWARSVGLEIVNELPALKSALMGQAGADADGSDGGLKGTAWATASSGIEGARTALNMAAGMAQAAVSTAVSSVTGKK